MNDHKCSSLEDALQRILFWSSLFWQSQHTLVGIGRLDKVLARYKLDIPESVQIIGDFYSEMHRHYAFKSSGKLLGDTGQIIVLGGIDPNGDYFCNEYTHIFIAVSYTHLDVYKRQFICRYVVTTLSRVMWKP